MKKETTGSILLENKLKKYLIKEYKRILRIDVNCRSLQVIYDTYRKFICNGEGTKELLDAFGGLREEAYREKKEKNENKII